MPVEIRELIIRAITTGDGAGIAGQERSEDPLRRPETAEDKQAIIQECVRQVLRILQQNKER